MRAFTLVETSVSAALLSLILLFTLSPLLRARDSLSLVDQRVRAIFVARDLMEQARASSTGRIESDFDYVVEVEGRTRRHVVVTVAWKQSGLRHQVVLESVVAEL